jgi:3-dehydroquinate synthetase
MYRSGFINQKNLENILTSLKLESKNTSTKITNFAGQLERDKKHKKPHWQLLFIETEKQTTKIKVVKALSQSLFQKDSHFSIQVTPVRDRDFRIVKYL